MIKVKRVIPLALAISFSILGPFTSISQNSLSYAQSKELSYKNTIIKYVKEDSEYRLSEDYINANDGKKLIYDTNLEYAKELLDDESTSEKTFKTVAQEIYDAKKDIADNSNPVMEKAKLRVALKLEMIPAKDLIYKVPRQEYNKVEYDKLSKAYAKALTLQDSDTASDYEFIAARKDLKKAAETFIKENNKKAQIIELENSIKRNEEQVSAAENLLANYPNTVKNVAGKLKDMIKESKTLVKESKELLAKLK